MSFGKCYDLFGNAPKQSTEEWEITFTSFSEEAAIWRIVPFSNAEELFMISTKQIESTHLEKQPDTVSYFPFLFICPSSFFLLFTLSLLSYIFPSISINLQKKYRRRIDFRKLRRKSELSDKMDDFPSVLPFFSSINSTYEEGTHPT